MLRTCTVLAHDVVSYCVWWRSSGPEGSDHSFDSNTTAGGDVHVEINHFPRHGSDGIGERNGTGHCVEHLGEEGAADLTCVLG